MQIRDEHVDFAVVERLGKMLAGPPEIDYEVTLSYALFCTILCWSMQHIRIGQQSQGYQEEIDGRAVSVASTLRGESAGALPWRCDLHVAEQPKGEWKKALSTNEANFDLSAFGFLKMLRDAVAHGDKRKVTPIHSDARNGKRRLRGFELKLDWKTNEEFGTARLFHDDIVRIGSRLAQRYCDALKEAATDSHLAEDANHGVEERSSRQVA